MIIGDRIQERLDLVSMSQTELARRVRLTQPAISGLVTGSVQTSRHLHRIARALGTTPAYLTGETDDPDEGAPPEPELAHDERELVACYRALGEAQRGALLTIAMTMAGRAAPGRVHGPRASPQPGAAP